MGRVGDLATRAAARVADAFQSMGDCKKALIWIENPPGQRVGLVSPPEKYHHGPHKDPVRSHVHSFLLAYTHSR